MSNLQMRLKELRIENGYLQSDVAKILKISTSAYGYYEQGKSKMTTDALEVLSDLYGVTTDYLLGRSNHPKLNRRDERNIQKDLETMRRDYENGTLDLFVGKEEMDEEIKEFILNNMENVLILAKIKAKEKFTPKKFRK